MINFSIYKHPSIRLEPFLSSLFSPSFLKTILQTENLSKKYSSVLAVDSLTFGLEEGTISALLGGNGAGKTTTSVKLAKKVAKEGRKPMLVACDVYRPAAIKQLEILSSEVNAKFFESKNTQKPEKIVQAAMQDASPFTRPVDIAERLNPPPPACRAPGVLDVSPGTTGSELDRPAPRIPPGWRPRNPKSLPKSHPKNRLQI